MENIGRRIKELRKKRDLTQEKLADYIGVTYQSVSKWETGATYPDLSLIVPLAKLLKVSADELLGMNGKDEDGKRALLEEAYESTWRTGDLEERYKISKEQVSEYPGETKYLDRLAWCEAMRSFGFADDEEYIAEQEKAIGHFARVIEDADDERIKASSIQGIVQYLAFRGRYDEARKYVELYPKDLPLSYDKVLLTCLKGEEAEKHRQRMLNKALTDMLNLIGNNTLIACFAQEEIINALFPDKDYKYYNCFLAYNYLSRARIYSKDNEKDKAAEALKSAYRYSIDYDKFFSDNKEYRNTSPFFDKVEYNVDNICRTGTTTLKEDFFEALKSNVFDNIRDRNDLNEFFK